MEDPQSQPQPTVEDPHCQPQPTVEDPHCQPQPTVEDPHCQPQPTVENSHIQQHDGIESPAVPNNLQIAPAPTVAQNSDRVFKRPASPQLRRKKVAKKHVGLSDEEIERKRLRNNEQDSIAHFSFEGFNAGTGDVGVMVRNNGYRGSQNQPYVRNQDHQQTYHNLGNVPAPINHNLGNVPAAINHNLGNVPAAINHNLGNVPAAFNHNLGNVPAPINHNLGNVPAAINHNLGNVPAAINHNLGNVPSAINHNLGNIPAINNHNLGNVPAAINHNLDNVPAAINHNFGNVPAAINHNLGNVLPSSEYLEHTSLRQSAIPQSPMDNKYTMLSDGHSLGGASFGQSVCQELDFLIPMTPTAEPPRQMIPTPIVPRLMTSSPDPPRLMTPMLVPNSPACFSANSFYGSSNEASGAAGFEDFINSLPCLPMDCPQTPAPFSDCPLESLYTNTDQNIGLGSVGSVCLDAYSFPCLSPDTVSRTLGDCAEDTP
ncbi:hypothetical protein EGW08_006450 [Elysia chlorotica]|uniref:Uncharacterized protein n=1 Tax=Elysia chlorotica TaxID=188477 RepID=A0A3S1BPP5_ELYCH|nr:hypothetical protein EGW08_006450 [Elysia chlorotica]